MDDPNCYANEAKIKELYEKAFYEKQKKLNRTTVSCGASTLNIYWKLDKEENTTPLKRTGLLIYIIRTARLRRVVCRLLNPEKETPLCFLRG